MIPAIHDNSGFYLKEMEMEHQWELNQRDPEDAKTDTAAEPVEAAAPSIRANRDLYLSHRVEQVSKGELTADQHARFRDKAEALYGAMADMEKEDDGSSLSKRA